MDKLYPYLIKFTQDVVLVSASNPEKHFRFYAKQELHIKSLIEDEFDKSLWRVTDCNGEELILDKNHIFVFSYLGS